MPTYPSAAPTLSGDLMTINRLLQSPTLLQRRLRTIGELRFIADQLLTNRYRSTGGAIQFEQSEPIVNARTIESVAPGSEYPRDTPATGTAAIAAVSKWGQAVQLTDEALKRSVYMGQEVNRALVKVANTVITKVDRLATAAVASAVTATSAAATTWDNAAAVAWRDVEKAAAKIVDLNQGYKPDSILMSSQKYAYLMTDPVLAAFRRREASDNPVYGGDIERLGKYKIVYTSVSNLSSDDVWIYDSQSLGAMVDEAEVDAGYATMDNGLQYKTLRVDIRDAWDVWARRITVPIVQEPGAAVKITGTGSLG
jgi:hypothetical protein